MNTIAVHFGLSIAGLGLICSAAVTPDPFWKIITSAVGGTFFGTAFSGMFSVLSDRSFKKSITSIIAESVNAELRSEEKEILVFRKRYYHYNLTQMDGQHHWRLAIYDFRNSLRTGFLECSKFWRSKCGDKEVYVIKGAIRDSRLIFFIKAKDGKEKTAVEVFPFANDTYQKAHFGFWVMTTWDGNDALMPTIISEKPLHNANQVGNVPKEQSSKFNQTWEKGISRLNPVFPKNY